MREPESPSVPKQIERQIAATSPRWCSHTDRKIPETERSCQALVGVPAAVADIVGNETSPQQLPLAERRADPPTNGTGVRPCMRVLGSCCRRGPSCARSLECLAVCWGIRDGARLPLGFPEPAPQGGTKSGSATVS